jgi:hypothetical protein
MSSNPAPLEFRHLLKDAHPYGSCKSGDTCGCWQKSAPHCAQVGERLKVLVIQTYGDGK